MLYTFWAATCWPNDNIFSLHLHMELEVYQTTHQHYLLGASQIFISANDNWFTLYKCSLWCASLPDVLPRYKILKQRVCAFYQFHLWCPSSIDWPPLQKWTELHVCNIWLATSKGKASDGWLSLHLSSIFLQANIHIADPSLQDNQKLTNLSHRQDCWQEDDQVAPSGFC